MSCRYLTLPLVLALFCRISWAIDPFSALAVVGTAVSVVSTVTDTAGEIAGVTDAMSELYSELDGEAEVSSSSQKLITKLREVEATAREVGYTKEEIDSLLQSERGEAKSLVAVLRKLTGAIRTGKRVMQLISKLEKKAQAAQVESLEIEKAQLRVQYRLLNELVSRRIDEKKTALDEALSKKKQIGTHIKELKRRGARGYGASGVWTFPKIDRVLEKSLALAKKIRPAFFGLVLLAFFIRLIFYQFGLFAIPSFGILIRDVILFGLLMCAFPQLVHLMVGVSHELAERIAGSKFQDLTEAPTNFSWDLMGLAWVCSWIRFIAYCVADFLFNFGLAFLVILFPLVIFMAQMLGLRILLAVFLTMFLVLSLWPFFWSAVGVLAADLTVMKTDSNGDLLKAVLFVLLQLISPFVFLKLLSGQGIGQAVGGVVSNVSSVGARATSEFLGLKRGLMGNEKAQGGAPSFAIGRVSRTLAIGAATAGSAIRSNFNAPSNARTSPFRAAARGFVEGTRRGLQSNIPGRTA